MFANKRTLLTAVLGVSSFVCAGAASALSCSVTADHWSSGYVANVTVTNDGASSISSWEVSLGFNQSPGVTGAWGASVSSSGNSLNASNVSYNGILGAGASTSFGFQGTHNGNFQLPTCKAKSSGPGSTPIPTSTPEPTPTSPSATPVPTSPPTPTPPSSTPIPSTPTPPPAGDDLIVQENQTGFCSVEGTIDSNNGGFTGSGFANSENVSGAKIIWRVNAQYASAYAIEWRYANGGSANRSGAAIVNGSSQGTVDFDTTGAWSSWTSVGTSVNLKSGVNEIILQANTSSGLANIDYLKVLGGGTTGVSCELQPTPTPVATPVPTSPSNGYEILSQSGNPAQARYDRSKSKWSTSTSQADIILSHQFDNGGWPKNQAYTSSGSGGSGVGKATFDNNATVTEIVYMAQVYQNTGNNKYRDSARKAMDYILSAQYSSGGWPQFYPLKGGYADHVTFNDNAMASVLTVLHNAQQKNAPFHSGIFNDSDRAKMKTAIDKGVDYILKAQWRQNGKLTVWCAQHGKSDYKPKAARAYELESLSGSESVEVIGFLMTQPQSPAIKTAVQAGIAWFRSPDTILEGYVYDSSTEQKIIQKSGGRMWYRFYDLQTNIGFFSDRDGGKYYDIMEISSERRNGYSWGGAYGEKIISYANSVGY